MSTSFPEALKHSHVLHGWVYRAPRTAKDLRRRQTSVYDLAPCGLWLPEGRRVRGRVWLRGCRATDARLRNNPVTRMCGARWDETRRGDRFATAGNVEPRCCAAETNTTLQRTRLQLKRIHQTGVTKLRVPGLCPALGGALRCLMPVSGKLGDKGKHKPTCVMAPTRYLGDPSVRHGGFGTETL